MQRAELITTCPIIECQAIQRRTAKHALKDQQRAHKNDIYIGGLRAQR